MTTAHVFLFAGFAAFVIAFWLWLRNAARAIRAGVLDFSTFSMHPMFRVSWVLGGVMLVLTVVLRVIGDLYGVLVTVGILLVYAALLISNTGFVTKRGLCLPGARVIGLRDVSDAQTLQFVPTSPTVRCMNPIVYENTPENRERFAALLEHD